MPEQNKTTLFKDPALAGGVDPLGQFVGIGKEESERGTTFFGERDPLTGKRQERFVPGLRTRPETPESPISGTLTPGSEDVIPAPKTVPDVISSDGVQQTASGATDVIQRQTDIFNAQQTALKEETDALKAEITADFEASRAAALASQKEDRATEGAIQFKLGQKGTAFGLAQTKKNELARKAELQALLSEKEALLAKATRAFNQDNIKLYSEYIDQVDALDERFFQRQRQQKVDALNEFVKLSGVERAEEQEQRLGARLAFDVEKFSIGEERLSRTQDLAERKFAQEVTEEERKTTLENITNMANSLIPLEQLDDERITDLEIRSGLESGTFEAFYDSLLEDARQGNLIDELNIQQKMASIARTRRLAAGTGTGVGATTAGFVDEKTEKNVRNSVSSAITDFELGGESTEENLISAFNRVRGLYNESQATDQAILDVFNTSLGIASSGEEEVETIPGEIIEDTGNQAFGSGNFSEININERINTLEGLFEGQALQNQLLRDGYPEDVVKDKVNLGVARETIEFFGDTINKIFGTR